MSKKMILDVSGFQHEATHVRLYPAAEINQWRALVGQAQVQMGGVNTGIGFIGSPEWAIGGAVVSGLLNAGLTNASQKAGMENLMKAAALMDQIRAAGKPFPVDEVAGADLPNPKAWVAMTKGSQNIDMNVVGMMSRGAVLKQHNKTKDDIDKRGVLTIEIDVPFIATDDEFVTLYTESGTIQARWAAVNTYRIVAA